MEKTRTNRINLLLLIVLIVSISLNMRFLTSKLHYQPQKDGVFIKINTDSEKILKANHEYEKDGINDRVANGMANWWSEAGACTIYANMPQNRYDVTAMATLGHELTHCFVGIFHE